MTNKWFRRFMSAFLALALALNPIDTRAFATRALATAPESAGINDMQGKATPGLGALGRGIAGTIGALLGALGEAAVEEGTEHVGEAVEGAGETVGEAVEGAGETVGEAAEHVGEAAKGAEEAIKGAVEGGATAAEEGTTAAEGAAEQGAATAEEGTAASEEAEREAAEEAARQRAAEEDAAYAERDAEKTQTERSAEDQGKREAAEAARAANHYWGNPKELARHYAEHGEGVGATSKEEYADMAHELYLNKEQYQVKVDREGITRVYDAARNLFGAYNPDGTTKTYFAPTGGQAYFDKQKWAIP